MRFQVPESVRIKIGDILLDWAERLPKLKWLQQLQQIRADQREEAARAFEATRAPKGTEIEYLSFRMIEMYHTEDFSRLHNGILGLFPGLQDYPQVRGFPDAFRSFTATLSRSGWLNVGTIYRSAQGWVPVSPYRIMPQLPDEVDYINVALHVIMPSVFVVTLDVHLGSAATERLLTLHARHYLSAVRFTRLIPVGSRRTGYSVTSSEIELRRAILSWLDRLRSRVESCVRPFLEGYFMGQPVASEAHLPAVQVFALRGVPENEEDLQQWKRDARGWWPSLGLDLSLHVYGNNKLMFNWSGDVWRTQAIPPLHRPVSHLIVLWGPSVRSANADMFGGEIRSAVKHDAEHILTQMLPWMTTLRFLESIERSAAQIRQLVFGSIRSQAQLDSCVRLMETVRRQRMLLDRITSEFEQLLDKMNHMKGPLAALKYTGVGAAGRDRSLAGDWLERIKRQTSYLSSHLSHMDRSLSGYVTTQNMIGMYRLEHRMLVLARVAAFVAIVELLANWDAAVEQLLKLVGHLNVGPNP